jgi:hypothetical protein
MLDRAFAAISMVELSYPITSWISYLNGLVSPCLSVARPAVFVVVSLVILPTLWALLLLLPFGTYTHIRYIKAQRPIIVGVVLSTLWSPFSNLAALVTAADYGIGI